MGTGLIRVAAVVTCLLAACATDEERGSLPEASARLDALERLAVFNEVPPFAAVSGAGRRDECHEPEFERREPATWKEFTYQGSPETVLNHYASRLTEDGWRKVGEVANQGELPAVRYMKDLGGWDASILVVVIADSSSYALTAEDASSHRCPT